MKRRDVIKGLSILPIGGVVGASQAATAAPANDFDYPSFLGTTETLHTMTGPLKAGPEVYQSIGVEPIINCRGTFTIIGASVELPEVRAAMEYACRYFVQLDELALGVGKRLSEITGAEWGMVSSGCAAGMKHVTAACVTGGNPEKLIRIPDLSGFEKTEVIIPRSSRNVYDHALRNIGVKIITVDSIEELEKAISSRTAMIYLMSHDNPGPDPMSVENIAKIAKPKNVPILVDAAAEILTIPNVHLQKGATVVAYSGGKAIRGPQCAGLLLGDKNLLMSAWQASAPHHGPGRDNKVGREEVMGMLAAVETWVKRDHQSEYKTWLSYLDTIKKRVTKINGVQTTLREPTGLGNRTPVLTVSWDPAKLNIIGQEVANELAQTKPRIAMSVGGPRSGAPDQNFTSVSISSWMMQPGNDKVVADRLYEVLARKRSPRATTMKAPVTDITGRWDATIEFFNSTSSHTLNIEKQDGNWLQGSHKGDFAVRDMAGSIEGDQIKFRSTYRATADGITFTFSGKVYGDTMTGDIHMGEYLTAKFTAKKYTYPTMHEPIMVPVGPPLSS
ncbi:aminotransferase class V-fold PLP-dependent enzyme [Adhaeribacter aquaticus]|uniref:aminotransferase class V-fold PLP-dependent enzyme n=1 Tax=Adhaeribacter aquaticus TaxID=299567 RepID=UPI00041D5FC6|nr:aminotransferase class V-fold PLP-dependent enzyme [Adhaeribacter aquaticus]